LRTPPTSLVVTTCFIAQRVVFTAIVFLQFGCAPPPAVPAKHGFVLPQPKLVTPNEIEPTDKKKRQEIPPFHHFAVEEIYRNIEVIEPEGQENNIEDNIVKYDIIESLNFLFDNFGPALKFKNKIVLKIVEKPERHAFATLLPDGNRSISLDRIHFLFDDGEEFIVHELFHALYQTDQWRRIAPQKDIEGWAAYAQIVYRYRGDADNNEEIVTNILERFPILSSKQAEKDLFSRRFELLSVSEQQIAYMMAALPILKTNRYDVYIEYKKMISKYPVSELSSSTANVNESLVPARPATGATQPSLVSVPTESNTKHRK